MEQRTLHTLLDSFQKMELQDLGSILGSDVSPRLRKSQLVEQLHSYLRGEPRRWMSHLMERDVRLLRDLVHAGPEKVQYLDFADYPTLLEVTGLVEWDDSDEHHHKVWISREMYEIVAPEVEKVLGSGEKTGQFEMERVGLGYLNLFGILPTERFVDLMMDWYEHRHGTDMDRLSRMLHQSPLVKMYRYSDEWGDYLCSPCIDDIEEIFSLRQEMNIKRFKNLSWEEARDAGRGAPYFTVGLKTPEGMRLEQLYRRLGYEGFELIKAEHDTWMEAQYTNGRNDALFHPLEDSPLSPELDDESYLAACRMVADYANSVPRWVLLGQSAAETGLCLADAEWTKNPGEEASAAGLPSGLWVPHVSPDELCPCGSGLRYRHCHGKYLS